MYFYPHFCYHINMSFRTILQNSSHQTTVQQSKFICHLFSVKTAEDADRAIASVCKSHYKATHNVPAYIVGEEYKYSDDGEPAGTAGPPLLSTLRAEGLDYICVVVTRYFGGIKLGTGGLVRAYTDALKEALLHANVVSVTSYDGTEIEIDYTHLGSVEHYLKCLSEEESSVRKAVHIADKKYLERVTLFLYSAPDLTERIIEAITEITAATLAVKRKQALCLTEHFEVFEF